MPGLHVIQQLYLPRKDAHAVYDMFCTTLGSVYSYQCSAMAPRLFSSPLLVAAVALVVPFYTRTSSAGPLLLPEDDLVLDIVGES